MAELLLFIHRNASESRPVGAHNAVGSRWERLIVLIKIGRDKNGVKSKSFTFGFLMSDPSWASAVSNQHLAIDPHCCHGLE